MLSQSVLSLDFEFVYRALDQPLSYVFPILLLLLTLFSASRRRGSKSTIPIYDSGNGNKETAKKRWMLDAINVLREGYEKFQDKAFQVWTTEGNVVVIPPKFVNELKMLPDKIFPSSLVDFLQAQHTTFAAPQKHSPEILDRAIKHDLNKNLPRMFPDIKDELEHALDTEFPTFEDWTPFKIQPKIMRLICRVSGRAFVGHTFQRSEPWIVLNCAYTVDAFVSASLIRAYPSLLRPLAKYFIPSIRRMWAHNAQATSFLAPIVSARNTAEKELGSGYEKPNDTIEWIRDSLHGKDKYDYEYQGIMQLAIGAASIHTTSGIVTAALYNLATYPEYIPTLREEAAEVLAANNGVWTLESMSQLSKLDSFMKETQRCDPAGIIAFQRKTLREMRLSDGSVIPANTLTFSATEAISNSSSTYTSPSTFDGLRYHNARLSSPSSNSPLSHEDQFVSTSPTQLHFGAGRHACPGRRFASHEIKMILVNFLERYDLKLKDGEERPKNFRWQAVNSPDPMGEICLRSR